ncbi:MAG: hypothetical protein HQK60_08495 [Deltaproteobacteria bacterium]|nr:hypothetical protein [Deltaproteobacteria bacterium]
MAIPFTNRELEKAWRENLSASEQTKRCNAHRLLLFYAVECGLKAVIMKRGCRRRALTDDFQDIKDAQHDINKLLDCLNVTIKLRLPHLIPMSDVVGSRNNKEKRELNTGQINQMWRYGGSSSGTVSDQDLEKQLLQITVWIRTELR